MKRVFIVVLDSMGIGCLPDADEFGDKGANTFCNVYNAVKMKIPNLLSLGISKIEGVNITTETKEIIGCYGKANEVTKAKDTISGHWEIGGYITKKPFKIYPNGFPEELISSFEAKIGRKTLGNYSASGTDIINDLGDKHFKTGYPIVYTSADSVFQVAAHELVIPLGTLYEICKTARSILTERYGIGRVVARPFRGESGAYTRTKNRRDFSVEPEGLTVLDSIYKAGLGVFAIGKTEDIFCHRGITASNHTTNNDEGAKAVIDRINTHEDDYSLVFANLVDMDMLYGHRNNVEGYAKSIEDFDWHLGTILRCLHDDDLLIVTADHGCDPTYPGTNHTREYIPILVYSKNIKSDINLGVRSSFVDIGASCIEYLGLPAWPCGQSFISQCFDR